MLGVLLTMHAVGAAVCKQQEQWLLLVPHVLALLLCMPCTRLDGAGVCASVDWLGAADTQVATCRGGGGSKGRCVTRCTVA